MNLAVELKAAVSVCVSTAAPPPAIRWPVGGEYCGIVLKVNVNKLCVSFLFFFQKRGGFVSFLPLWEKEKKKLLFTLLQCTSGIDMFVVVMR